MDLPGSAARAHEAIVAAGYPAMVLTGDVNQAKRRRVIDEMKSGKVNRKPLITHTFPFPEVGGIMRKSSQAEEAIIKAVLVP